MNNEELNCPYLRVGTTYYKRIERVLLSGDTIEVLKPWSLQLIKQDHGRKWHRIFDEMPKFDEFTNIPAHGDKYRRSIKNNYNRYEPLLLTPKEGDWETIRSFLEHIFEEQYELGLDYLCILYQHPTQILPILAAVSKERSTGKTTLLSLLKLIFANNMTLNNNDDFRSNFNDSWVGKLVVGVDEVLLDRREDSERIKNLATARTYKIESKGVDKIETEYFGKFVLCSNNVEDFIIIDPLETRYWIREIKPLKDADPFLLEKMKSEVSAFMYLLSTRKIVSPNRSRMWFAPEQLKTDVLMRIKRRFRNKNEMELLNIISEIMDTYDLSEFSFTNSNAKDLLMSSRIFVNRGEMKRIIDNWDIKPVENPSNYTTYKLNSVNEPYETHLKGRYYTLTRSRIEQLLLLC